MYIDVMYTALIFKLSSTSHNKILNNFPKYFNYFSSVYDKFVLRVVVSLNNV